MPDSERARAPVVLTSDLLLRVLTSIHCCLAAGCPINLPKQHPSTSQLLLTLGLLGIESSSSRKKPCPPCSCPIRSLRTAVPPIVRLMHIGGLERGPHGGGRAGGAAHAQQHGQVRAQDTEAADQRQAARCRLPSIISLATCRIEFRFHARKPLLQDQNSLVRDHLLPRSVSAKA
jgi:hypothetical protein